MKSLNTLLFILSISLAFGQVSKKEIKGNKAFEFFNYSKAIELYESTDDISIDGHRKLATSYRKFQDMENAEESYANLVEKEGSTPEDIYYYAYVLKENKKYLEAEKWMDKFGALASSDSRAELHISDKVKIEELLQDKGQFTVNHLNINSANEDFAPSFYQDKVVFASSREGKKLIKRKWAGNKLPFLNMYVADVNSNELSNPSLMIREKNKKYHEGPVAFAREDKFMAYTSNNYDDVSSDGVIKLKLFFTENKDGKWSEGEPFKLNNKEYSVGHPSLTEDGNTMYFTSDMPGGYGGSDIYKISRDETGEWGEAQNLGNILNTEGNEMFPFYSESEKLLFFASDGHVGLGGLDVFVAPNKNNSFIQVLNLAVPINSSNDDFGLILDAENKSGFFSSNREEGKGDDDLYSFTMLKPFVFGKRLEGVAMDKNNDILSNVSVKLYDNGTVVDSVVTDDEGKFSFAVEKEKNYTLDGNKTKYFPGKNKASTFTEAEVVYANLLLEKDPGITLYGLITDAKDNAPLENVDVVVMDNFTGEQFLNATTLFSGDFLKGLAGKRVGERLSYNIKLNKDGYFPKNVTFNTEIVKPGVIKIHESLDLSMDAEVKDLADLVEINPIKFDLNKYNIRPDAATELDKIVAVMNKYPNMIVELGSHTDCRGSMKYNERLSDNRAKSSAEYIKSKIPNASNISGKGYGENRILNGCTCEGAKRSTCTEAQHSENRRTEFKVLSTGNDKLQVKNNSTDSFDK